VDDGASSAASSIDEACDAVFFSAAPGAELSDPEAAKLLTSCATSFYTWPASRPPPFAPVPSSQAPWVVEASLLVGLLNCAEESIFPSFPSISLWTIFVVALLRSIA